MGVVIYREIRVRDLYSILRKSIMSSAVIMFIIANAGLFAFLITRGGVPDAIGHWLQDVLRSPALDRIVRDLVPFVTVVLCCLMVVTYVPSLSLGLRDLAYK